MLRGLMSQAFVEEDKPIIEAAFSNLDGEDFWAAKPVFLGVDAAGTRARRLLQTMISRPNHEGMQNMSRVTEIRYVGYGVPDLEAERAFYRDIWGLKEVGEKDGMVALRRPRAATSSTSFRLRASEARRIDVIALAADSRADVDALHDKVVAADCRIIFAPQGSRDAGRRLRLPLLLQGRADLRDQQRRRRAAPQGRWSAGKACRRRSATSCCTRPTIKATAQFFIDVLGFRLSDWLGDFMCFLRCNSARITGWRSCPGRPASTTSPTTCSRSTT